MFIRVNKICIRLFWMEWRENALKTRYINVYPNVWSILWKMQEQFVYSASMYFIHKLQYMKSIFTEINLF